jgi:hypothetical protein
MTGTAEDLAPDVNMEDLPEDGDGILLRFLEA